MEIDLFIQNYQEETDKEKAQEYLMDAVQHNNLYKASILMSLGLNPNKKDASGRSPLLAAAGSGYAELVGLFLNYQPDLEVVNKFGGTTLLPSSEKGYLKTVKLVLEAGVAVNRRNDLGWSALHEAVILGSDNLLYQEIINQLISYGADIDLKDFSQKSPLDYASEKNNRCIYNLLKNPTEFKDKIDSKKTDFFSELIYLNGQENSVKKYYKLGQFFENYHLYQEANESYQKGLKEDNQFAYYLANLMRLQNKQEEALFYFDLGIKNDVTDFYLYQKSNYLREIGQHQVAINVMEELLDKDPQRTDYMFHASNSYQALNDFKEAYHWMEKATNLEPKTTLFKKELTRLSLKV